MINVTKTFLPPMAEYQAILQRAWDKQWLTNRGELVLELEDKLKTYLNIPFVISTTNGTIPLQIALKNFGNYGEVITTPFSYVATTASIVWEGCTPVFVDIHPEYLTIDETKIEAAITSKTTAILATHVFGNPCDVFAIEAIAKRYKLKVIYDAAHAFAVVYKGKSILSYGDISTCSFHATKLFHTGEGGALCCSDETLYKTLFYLHNFGHNGPLDFQGLGINAKMSELQAAMGLAVLPYIDIILNQRQHLVELYDTTLDFSKISKLKLRDETEWNYSYYPVIFQTEEQLLNVEKALKAQQIIPRRYFYPGLNTLPYLTQSTLVISDSIYKRVLCLPLYHDLSNTDITMICDIINTNL